MVWMVTRLNVLERRFEGPLAKRLTAAASSVGITLYWLGQAGFVIQAGVRRLVIDPYLSDTLAAKYRGTATPHERMERPPMGLSVATLRAAHETLETDIEGNHRFLGYALIFKEEGHDVSIIHSGDTPIRMAR
jgi:L-ascorbate metabolism protein UlaG (beta-lactamase superfamily)